MMSNDSLAVIVILGALIYLINRQTMAIQASLDKIVAPDDEMRIEARYNQATDQLHKRRAQLIEQKAALPGIGLWDIAGNPDWESQLVTRAEKLRYLIPEVYGKNTPDEHHVRTTAMHVSMTYELAHWLAELAHADIDIQIRRADWTIEKLTALFESRQKYPNFDIWASSEMASIDIQRSIQKYEDGLVSIKNNLWSEYQKATQSVALTATG